MVLSKGAIVGASGDVSMMWVMTAVVLGHKWAEAMLLMCQLLDRKVVRAQGSSFRAAGFMDAAEAIAGRGA